MKAQNRCCLSGIPKVHSESAAYCAVCEKVALHCMLGYIQSSRWILAMVTSRRPWIMRWALLRNQRCWRPRFSRIFLEPCFEMRHVAIICCKYSSAEQVARQTEKGASGETYAQACPPQLLPWDWPICQYFYISSGCWICIDDCKADLHPLGTCCV